MKMDPKVPNVQFLRSSMLDQRALLNNFKALFSRVMLIRSCMEN